MYVNLSHCLGSDRDISWPQIEQMRLLGTVAMPSELMSIVLRAVRCIHRTHGDEHSGGGGGDGETLMGVRSVVTEITLPFHWLDVRF
eukprot:COSAG01_NODE_4892_length_4648_cov_3.866344_3_plen_87_part_00